MTLLAFHIQKHTGLRLAEIGEVLGLIAGLALLVGGMTPFGKRAGQMIAGIALALGFLLLAIATHWGHFH